MNITLINKKYAVIPSWWVALLTVVLIGVVIPPFVARCVSAWGEETRSEFLAGKDLPETQLRDFISGRELAVKWFPYSGYYSDMSMLALERVGKDQARAQAYLDSAGYWQKKALQVAPADPYGWFRMAYVFESLGQKDKAARAWQQSYISAPYEPRLLLSRLGMARRLEAQLGDEAPALILQLIRQAWEDNPWHLARKARDEDFLDLAREALQDDPVSLQRLDKILREQL